MATVGHGMLLHPVLRIMRDVTTHHPYNAFNPGGAVQRVEVNGRFPVNFWQGIRAADDGNAASRGGI
jgi:hypothetical protein